MLRANPTCLTENHCKANDCLADRGFHKISIVVIMLGSLFEQEDEEFPIFVEENVVFNHPEAATLKKKMDKPSEPRDPLGFVGLENQGATCYLNSLIQVMYMTPELREGLYKIDPMELGLDLVAQHEAEKANLEKKGAVEPDDNLLEALLAMGVDEAAARYALIKTKNKGIEDAFECITELGDNPPPIQESPKKKKKPRYVPLELQRLFSELQLVDKATISTQDLTTKGFNWQSFDGRVQHDAHELNRLLVDGLEKSLKKTSGDMLCKTLYEGTMVNQILCTKCHRISEREESFYDLNMQVIDCSNVVQALHNFCKKEVLDGDSAYACETCGTKTRALRCSKLKRLPNILTFSCNRFKIDRSTNWQRVKVTSTSAYPLILNMNPFVYGYSLNDLETNEEEESKDLETVSVAYKTMVWIDTIKQEAESYLDTCFAISGKSSLLEFQWSEQQIDQFKCLVVQSLEAQDPYIQTQNQNNYRYALHSIIIHRGSAYSGHYYAYIRDNLHEAKFMPTDPSLFKIPSTGTSSSKDTVKTKHISRSPDNSSSANIVDSTSSDIKEDYLFDEVTQNTFVCQDSVIHKLLYIFEREQTSFIQNTNKRRGGFNKNKPFFLKSGAIARNFSSEFATNWSKVYKAKYGSIEDFLRKHAALFIEYEPNEFSLQPDLVTSIIDEDAFRSLYNSKQGKNSSVSGKGLSASSAICVNDVEDSNMAMDVDSDEALARALQETLDREESAGHRTRASASAGVSDKKEETSTTWQTAGKKKDRKTTVVTPPVPEPATDIENVEEKAAENALLLRRQNLVEDLLRYTAGLFLEFNDSRVSQITFDTLQRAFQGVDSAYLMVYRRIQSFQCMFPQQLFSNSRSIPDTVASPPKAVTSSKLTVHKPFPPSQWQEKIASYNQQIAAQRLAYHEHLQQRVVSVYFQSSLQYDTPCFTVNIHGAAEKASSNTPCIHIDTDTRKTIQELLTAIFYPNAANEDASESQLRIVNKSIHLTLLDEFRSKFSSLTKDNENELSQLMSHVAVSRLDPVVALAQQGSSAGVVEGSKAHNHFFYASQPALPSDTIGAFINQADASVQRRMGSLSMLMIWLPATAQQTGIVFGNNSRPVPIKSWVLEHPHQSNCPQMEAQQKGRKAWGVKSASSSTSSAINTISNASIALATQQKKSLSSASQDPNEILVTNVLQLFYVPGNLTLFDSVLFLAHKYALDASRQVVSARVPDVAAATAAATMMHSNNGTRTTRAATKAISANSADNTKVTKVFDQGIVSLQSALSLLGNSQSHSFNELTPIADLWFVRELYFEDYTAQGFNKTSLAERFLMMQLHMISITVEFDVSIIKIMQKADPDYDLPDSVDVEVFKTSTLASVKEKVLNGYNLLTVGGITMDSCRVRLGSKPGESVLENEEEALTTLGIKSNMRLYLETGSIARAPETVIVNLLLVHGNSTAMKYPANEAGWRVGENSTNNNEEPKPITMEVPLCITVKELRDLVGTRLLNFPTHWTDVESSLLPVNSIDVSGTEKGEDSKNGTDAATTLETWKENLKHNYYYQNNEYRGRRLRRTSWMGEFADLLLEIDKKQSPMTLKEAEIKDGDLLLLEEGRLPVRGKHDLRVYFWHDHPLLDLPSSASPQQKDDEDDASVMIVDYPSPPVSVPMSNPTMNDVTSSLSFSEKVALAQRQRFQCLHLLGEIQVSVNGTLGDMHSVVSDLVKRSRNVLLKRMSCTAIDYSMDHAIIEEIDGDETWNDADRALWTRLGQSENLLLREMRPDTLPGKCMWMVDSTHVATTTNLSATKESNEARRDTDNKDNSISKHFGTSNLGNTPWKKLSLKPERGIVVQLLPKSQLQERGPAGSIRIWVQRLLNPQHAAAGGAQLSPTWPPLAAVLQGGIAPTLGHLHRAILNAMPQVATGPEQLVVYKYNLQKFAWEEMKHLNDGTGSKKKVENLFQAPYNVKEGSLFCAFSKMDLLPATNSHTNNSSASVSSKVLSTISTAMDISLPMDLFMQQERAEAAMRKKLGKGGDFFSASSENNSKGVLKKPEHALALYIDLDDWDDE